MRRRAAARAAAGILGLLAAAGCGRRPAPAPPAPPEPEPEPPAATTADVARSTGATTIVDRHGERIWHVTGVLRVGLAAGGASFEMLDAELRCLLTGIDAVVTVGRTAYQPGGAEVGFDRRVHARWPLQQAELRAERAAFDLDRRVFVLREPFRATRAGTILEAADGEVALDLSSMALHRVTGRGEVPQGRWTAAAAEATGDGAAHAILTGVKGTIAGEFGTVSFAAPKAAWKPELAWLNFAEGVAFEHQGGRARADAATWESGGRRIVTRGTTRLVRGGLTASGTDARIDLVSQRAVMSSIRVDRDGTALRAVRGTVDRAGNLALEQVTAERDGAVVTAPRVRFSQAADRLEADGGVSLRRDGVNASCASLAGPSDLSRASLNAVRADGRRAGRRWSVRAPSGEYAAEGGLTLAQPRATMTDAERSVTASAGRVTVSADGAMLTFGGGLRIESPGEGLSLRAERGHYDLARRTLVAEGGVTGRARGLAIRSNGSWSYEFGPPPASGAQREAPPHGETTSGEVAGATGEGRGASAGDDPGSALRGGAADDPPAAR